jgi:Raf kinase inhibitor-like YbhB/YbcL family protein
MHDPYAHLPEVPSFTVTSTDVTAGGSWPAAQYSALFGVAGGEDVSPQLAWSGFPAETRSFAVTIFDPDAPIPSGFWHWAVHDLPSTTTSLASGAGDPSGSALPAAAIQVRNDGGQPGFIGAAPPVGHGPHRYFIVVHALDVPTLGPGPDATPAVQGFMMFSHTLARATMVVIGER